MQRDISKIVLSITILFLTRIPTVSQVRLDTAVLRKVVASEIDDSTKMVAHLSLGKYYVDNNNDSSIAHTQQAYLLALKLKSKKYEAQTLDVLGAALLRRGNVDEALGYLLKGLKLFESQQEKTFLIVSNRNIAAVYKSQNDTNIKRLLSVIQGRVRLIHF